MRKFFALLFAALLAVGQLHAQQRTVTGKVQDENGVAIPNASVLVKGTTIGTITRPDGAFSLNISSNSQTLVISAVGKVAQEITIGSRSSIEVSLKGQEGTMQEIVVVGYGTQRRSEATSSIAKIGGDKVANVPLSSIDQILQGKVSGLQTSSFSGQPGANQQIRIRGTGSFSVSSQPLYVVDGVQINSGDLSRLTTTSNVLANINPDDIESVSVLKDAAATAIYGSRGGNGVIVITTKKGRAGKTQFSFSAEVGANRLGDVPDAAKPLNATQWLTLYKESYLNAGGTQGGLNTNLASLGDTTGATSIDWLHLVTRTGTQQQYNLSASGGDDRTRFYISGGYFKQQASTIGSDLTRYSVVANLEHSVGRKLSFSIKMEPTYTKENAVLSNGSQFANPVLSAFFLRPLQNPYNADGSLNISTAPKDFQSVYNPLYLAQQNQHSLGTFSGIGNAQAKYNILSNLAFTSRIGLQYSTLEEYQYDNPFHGDGVAAKGRGYSYYTRYFLYDYVNQLDYHANLTRNKDLTMDAKVASEAILSKGFFISAQSQNYSTPRLPLSTNASTVTIGQASAADYSFASLFGNVSFNYKGKYILAGTLRRDGSSKFGVNNEYGTFPSVSAAWNVSKEKFFEPVSFVSDLKLRASYGSAGNAELGTQTNPYVATQAFSFGANYNNQPGGTFNILGNKDLTWERDNQFDIGLDAAVLKNRIDFVIDYYDRVSSRLLFNIPLSQTTGFASFTGNVGKLENKGIELTINATAIQTPDFQWDINFNFTHNKNILKTLPEGQTQIINGQFLVKPGLDINTWFMRQWAGVDPANGNPLWYVDSSRTTTTSNYSNSPNPAQRVNTGKTADPKYFGGLSNTFSYHGFSLTADFYYNYGNYVWDQWGSFLADETNPTYGKYSLSLDRWQKPGDITNVPKLFYGATNSSGTAQNSSSNATSTRFLYKGDFIRLRNVSVGYRLSRQLTDKLHVSSFYFYVRGTNLWTKTYDKNLTIDPEQGGSSNTNANIGTNNLNLFYNKVTTVGINIGF
jgi:TonB-dependent starch-binding outer membrane protein SusC